MTSAEVLAVKRLIDEIPVDLTIHKDKAKVKYVLGVFGWWLSEQEQAAADALAAAEKAEAEAAELAAYGGIAAAEAGWNALRQHNPKVDRSTGVYGEAGEVRTFSDLPFKKKLEYAAIAFGVLNPGAKLSKARRFETFRDVPEGLRVVDRQGDVVWWSGGDLLCARFDGPVNRGPNSVFAWADQFAPFVEDETGVESESAPESHQFKVGDRVEIERPDVPGIWVSPDLLDAATVRFSRSGVTDVCDANGLEQTVPNGWLTLVREPREWDSLAYVPHTVTVTDRTGDTLEFRHGEWWTAPNNSNVWGETGKSFRSLAGGFSISDLDEFAPYTEVIA